MTASEIIRRRAGRTRRRRRRLAPRAPDQYHRHRHDSDREPPAVVRDGLRRDDRVVTEGVSEPGEQTGPQQRADDVQDEEGNQPHPGPASNEKNDRPRDRQESADHHGWPGKPPSGLLDARHVPDDASAARKGHDEALAP